MEKNKILSYVAMGAGALFIISLFLPYVSAYSTSISLWKLKDGSRVIFLLLGLAVAALYVFNKKTELTYTAGGFGFFTCLSRLILNEGFDNLSIGFYLLFLASIAMLVVTFMYDESKGTSLFNFNISVSKNPNPAQTVSQPIGQPMQQPVNQPMGQPMNQPMQQPVNQPMNQPMPQQNQNNYPNM